MASQRSKIPIRIESKSKYQTNSEIGLTKSSAVARIRADVNLIDRSEPFKKEQKTDKLSLKSKSKENISKVSGKISQTKVPNIGAAKAVTAYKGIKCSKPVSRVLKDRNKITTQVPEKSKPVKDKEKKDQLGLFREKIPEINILDDDPFKADNRKEERKISHNPSQSPTQRKIITTKKAPTKFEPVKDDPFSLVKKKIPEISTLDDDPFNVTTKKEKNKNSNHPSQPDIEFVADESMKNLILSNKELTPRILLACSNRKMSSVNDRPSMYSRPRISVDPYKQALADIANYKIAAKGQRISEMQKNKLLPSSPFRVRNSLYKKPFFGDPYEEAMKSIAELRIQRKAKTCKKVTFKISEEGPSSMTETKCSEASKKVVSLFQSKLADKAESKSSLTPEFEPIALSLGGNLSKKLTYESPSIPDEVFVNRQINDMPLPEKVEEKINDCFINNNFSKNISTSSVLKKVVNKDKVNDLSPALCQNKDSNAAILNRGIKNSILKNVNPFLNLGRDSEVRQSFFSNQSEHFLDKKNPKIFTPQPVSFYPRTKLSESISPEFLSKKNADILSCAPINTPLVLKRLGRQEQSPICKKLEFKDSPKETQKEPCDSRENSQTFYLQNIMTQQKILDQLAHQECSIFMHGATFPCEIRNYLQNPIAQILNDGDETHFVPVSIRRLS